MRKGVMIGIAAAVGLVALFGWAGWRILTKPIDPSSATGQNYAENFRKSFADECTAKLDALGGEDQDRHRKVVTVCQCGADGSYEEFRNLPVPEQFAQLQSPEMQHKIGEILKACAQKVGLQLGGGSQ
jgi:hypothetical protein